MSSQCTQSPLDSGKIYLTEGGIETEVMYKHGFKFPHFAVFELLKNPDAVAALEKMYKDYLDVVAKHQMAALVGGLDYRASPDWGALLGYSPEGLADMNRQCIDFLRRVAKPYSSSIDSILFQGYIGPRGDAYERNDTITENEAQDYHSVQLQTLKDAKVDLATALTFNNIPEAIGLARAAHDVGLPLSIGFSVTADSKLNSGPSLQQAIEDVDAATGSSVAFYKINCAHPIEYEPALAAGGEWTNRLGGVRPNASKMDKLSLCKIGHLEDGDPVELGAQVGSLVERYPQMNALGGCCGTWERHLDEIAFNVSRVREAAVDVEGVT